ncbi:redoxin domain-containing protein [Actinomycetes bacterium KLBMP 9797]
MVLVGRAVAAAAVAMVAVAVTGCGGNGDSGAAASDPPSGAVTPSTAAPVSPSATSSSAAGTEVPRTLAFTATTVEGKPFDAATLADKPVVFWFWAAWCPRCRAAADDVAAVRRDFANRVHVVGVAGLNSGDDAMRAFVADRGIGGFVNLADDEGAVWRRFEVTAQEYYVVLDATGSVVHKGPMTGKALRDRVTALAG